MTRPTGFYWVLPVYFPKTWQPARWDTEGWLMLGKRYQEGDYVMTKIGPRIEDYQE